MSRLIGTISRGIVAPIFRQNDDLVEIIPNLILDAAKEGKFELRDRDVLCITESIVARTQGNYATIDDIASDIKNKTANAEVLGITFPILSRNRFSILLKGIAKATKKVVILLSYPSDEVGNHLFDPNMLLDTDINPWQDVLTEKQFVEIFGEPKHTFTGMNYVEFYRSLVEGQGAECEIIFSNDCRHILDYAQNVITCDIHTRERSKKILTQAGAKTVLGLDNILTEESSEHGYNCDYGLLGSNKADDELVKLFPHSCQELVDKVAQRLRELSGKNIEVMIYGDGAFKDPVGKIWELADPVVSPAYTPGLDGTPHEMKIKYLADSEFKHLEAEELAAAIRNKINNKDRSDLEDANSVEAEKTEGTTPRRLTDLLGSLSDLTSGSGDKGTPIVYVQGYFDNWADA